jgi:hypothetical protein
LKGCRIGHIADEICGMWRPRSRGNFTNSLIFTEIYMGWASSYEEGDESAYRTMVRKPLGETFTLRKEEMGR